MATTSIKCPECGGDKAVDLGNNVYECGYCGASFKHETESDQPAIQTSDPEEKDKPVHVNVTINQDKAEPEKSNAKSSFSNGVAGGMGGCLGGAMGGVFGCLAVGVIVFLIFISIVNGCTSALSGY